MVRLHLGSVLAGVGASAVLVALMSQSSVTPTFPSARFSFGPHPRDFITVREGTTFTVPTGQVFVVSALGSASVQAPLTRFLVDGVLQYTAQPAGDGVRWACTSFPVPGPMVFHSGQTVSVEDNDGATLRARLWGYVATESMNPAANPIKLRVEYAPRPTDVVSIRQGMPFTVPAGKLFVPTALGHRSWGIGGDLQLRVNGVGEIGAEFSGGAASSTVGPVPQGLTVPSGATIDVAATSGTDAVAWGYLVDI